MALPDIIIDHGSTSKAARNEVRKISATWLNGLSVALIAAGIIVPLISLYPAYIDHALGNTHDLAYDQKLFLTCWISGCAFAVGIAFHIRALFIVRRLED